MYKNKTVCVVIPAYNEETQITKTITTIPDFVDHIVVVDDRSTDQTVKIVENMITAEVNKPITDNKKAPRIVLLKHEQNRGVGGAISTGYIWCRNSDVDIAVVMAGDGQMDPADLPELLDPIIEQGVDYTKGNRLITGESWEKIPHVRYLGNSALTLLTKIASGYWHVTDSQSGYTALNKKALHLLPLEKIYPRYGMPNDFLVTLNIYDMRVKDVPVNPLYGIGEKSGIKIQKIIFTIFLLLVKCFFRRMIQKYVIRDFHPLIFFYLFGFLLLFIDAGFVVRLFYLWASQGSVPPITALTVAFCTIMGFQAVLFAMLFDMEHNKHLK